MATGCRQVNACEAGFGRRPAGTIPRGLANSVDVPRLPVAIGRFEAPGRV